MIKWFVEHPTAANLCMLMLVILGLTTLPVLQRETFPAIGSDRVSIQVYYPGATAAEVEDAICRRLEDALENITDLDEIRCASSEGRGVATVIMTEGSDMTQFLADIKSEVDSITDFPAQVEAPVIAELGRTDAVVSIAITGPENPLLLKSYAEDVKQRLLAAVDVANVEIEGFSTHHIRVEIAAATLRRYGLSMEEVATRMRDQSIGVPTGQLTGAEEDLLLRTDDQRKSVESLGQLIIVSSATGALIRLADIATITDRFDHPENQVLFDGQRAAILTITKTNMQDVLRVHENIVAFVENENQQAPIGTRLTLTQGAASIVKDRLDMILGNAIQGLIIVFLILWLFFSFRYSFWVTMGLPISFLGAFYLLPMLGITINMISMVGLLIGIGLLMDDAIVIAENIAAGIHRGESAMQAAVTGVTQVLPGILSSFATTLLVFGSLAFITGEIGQVLRVLPIVLIVIVSISLVEALLILPHHLGHSLRATEKHPDSRFRMQFEKWFDRLRERYFGTLLDYAVEYRYLTLGLALMSVILALALPASGQLKFVGFPTIEGDIVEARLLLPQGTPLSRTEALVEKIQAAAQALNREFKDQQPEQQDLVRHIVVIYGQNPDAFESGPHVARIIVDLLSAEVRNTSLEAFRNAWRLQLGTLSDVISLKFSEPAFGPGGRPIEIRLKGADLERLKQASEDMQSWFRSYAGVADLIDDLRPGKRELRLSLKDSAAMLGIHAKTVSNQVRSAFQGITTDEFPLGLETYEVNLRLEGADRLTAHDLEQMTIRTNNGHLVPVSTVVDIEEARGWGRINRINRQRTVTVYGDLQREQVNAQELLQLASTELFPQLKEKYPDVEIDTRGESQRSAKTSQSMLRNVLLGLFGVYMLLAFQFRGYAAPITVMAIIPTALIGVMGGHWLLGLDLTMPSIVGLASLFGVVVNDSILLVLFMRNARAEGVDIYTAAKQAGRNRFRPILLTSITTVAGLLPLLLETSLQAQVLIPLAASIAFGLTSAVLIGLFLVPALYCILDDFNLLGEADQHTGATTSSQSSLD